jgi:transposase
MTKVFVGIDVAKEYSTAQGLDRAAEKLFYLRFAMDATGFAELKAAIQAHAGDLAEVTVAMESTGCYHINLFSFLCAKAIHCVVINPLLIANFTRLSLRKTKTDKKDALTIARFLLANEGSLQSVVSSQDAQDMRDLARERESLTIITTNMKIDIKRLLQVTFPELESLCKPYNDTMLHFLQQFPSARLIRKAKLKDLERALICPGEKRKRVQVTAEEIVRAAKRSVASGGVAKELILSEKAATVVYLQDKREKITDVLVEACESLRIEELDIIKSLDGVDDITGSTFLAELGDISNFSSYKHVIAFAGLDPSVHQSGQYEGQSRISKRGNSHLRRIIFMMTMCATRHDNVFKAYFLKRKQEGLRPMKAMLATAHKLIRVIFSMLSNKTTFRKEVAGV